MEVMGNDTDGGGGGLKYVLESIRREAARQNRTLEPGASNSDALVLATELLRDMPSTSSGRTRVTQRLDTLKSAIKELKKHERKAHNFDPNFDPLGGEQGRS